MKRFALALALVAVVSCDAPTPPTEPVGPTVPGANSPDSAALAALYHATDGDNWKRNDNWLSGEDLGDWYGVATDTSGRVTRLYLSENDLSGPIPSELGDLSRLEKLSVNDTRLTGRIPLELGNLGRLTDLDLGYNSLSGPIPSELGKFKAPKGPASLPQRADGFDPGRTRQSQETEEPVAQRQPTWWCDSTGAG